MGTRLKDKVCIVTGGGAGLGEATCRLFAEEGGQVVVADIDAASAEGTADEIAAAGGSAIAVEVDVAQEDAVQGLVRRALEFGGRIDVLVNNAAAGGAPYNFKVTDVPMDVWQRCVDVNLKGPLLCMKYVIPRMLEQKKGAIVNIGSISSVVGLPAQAIYAPTKAAIMQLTRQAASDYTRGGIRINCVLPGGMHTPMMQSELDDPGSQEAIEQELALLPIGRYADPREVACAVLFLASDEASFVVGAVLSADGGYTAQ